MLIVNGSRERGECPSIIKRRNDIYMTAEQETIFRSGSNQIATPPGILRDATTNTERIQKFPDILNNSSSIARGVFAPYRHKICTDSGGVHIVISHLSLPEKCGK